MSFSFLQQTSLPFPSNSSPWQTAASGPLCILPCEGRRSHSLEKDPAGASWVAAEFPSLKPRGS